MLLGDSFMASSEFFTVLKFVFEDIVYYIGKFFAMIGEGWDYIRDIIISLLSLIDDDSVLGFIVFFIQTHPIYTAFMLGNMRIGRGLAEKLFARSDGLSPGVPWYDPKAAFIYLAGLFFLIQIVVAYYNWWFLHNAPLAVAAYLVGLGLPGVLYLMFVHPYRLIYHMIRNRTTSLPRKMAFDLMGTDAFN